MITFISTVDILTSVHAFSSQEVGSLESVFIRVSEDDLGEGSTTAGIVDDLSDDTLDVTRGGLGEKRRENKNYPFFSAKSRTLKAAGATLWCWWGLKMEFFLPLL